MGAGVAEAAGPSATPVPNGEDLLPFADVAKQTARRMRKKAENIWRRRTEADDGLESSNSSDSTFYIPVPSTNMSSRIVANLRGELLVTKGVNTTSNFLRGASDLLKHVIKIDAERLSEL